MKDRRELGKSGVLEAKVFHDRGEVNTESSNRMRTREKQLGDYCSRWDPNQTIIGLNNARNWTRINS